jgi:hypothetical protein
MILRNTKPLPNYYDTKEIEKYALFPTRMKREPYDKTGEIIWLESYVKVYKHDRKENKLWSFYYSERKTLNFLRKLEESESKSKEYQVKVYNSQASASPLNINNKISSIK